MLGIEPGTIKWEARILCNSVCGPPYDHLNFTLWRHAAIGLCDLLIVKRRLMFHQYNNCFNVLPRAPILYVFPLIFWLWFISIIKEHLRPLDYCVILFSKPLFLPTESSHLPVINRLFCFQMFFLHLHLFLLRLEI